MSFFWVGHFEFLFSKKKYFFCFIPMKISPNLYGRMDGLKFWRFPWFPANSLVCVIKRYTVYVIEHVDSVPSAGDSGFHFRWWQNPLHALNAAYALCLVIRCQWLLWVLLSRHLDRGLIHRLNFQRDPRLGYSQNNNHLGSHVEVFLII